MAIPRKKAALALLLFFTTLYYNEAFAEKKIGVFLFSSETRYEDAFRGFKDRLNEVGFGEPEVTFTVENANANKATATELVQKLVQSKADLFFTAGTSATVMLLQSIKERPVVFSVVYDPVKSGIAKTWHSSGNNTTGTSTLIPMSKIIDTLKQLKEVKRLAVLYSPGESNSEYQVRDLLELQQTQDLKVLPVPMTKSEDFTTVLPEVMRTSDAVYVTGSNFVDNRIASIVELANTSKTVTVSHLEDLIEKGVLLGVTSSSYQIGQQAGDKAAMILRGSTPASIPIDTAQNLTIVLNLKSAEAAQVKVPEKFLESVGRTIR